MFSYMMTSTGNIAFEAKAGTFGIVCRDIGQRNWRPLSAGYRNEVDARLGLANEKRMGGSNREFRVAKLFNA